MVKGKIIEDVDVEEEITELKDDGYISAPIEYKPTAEFEPALEPEFEQEVEVGEVVNYTEKVEYGVVDEEGNRIPCSSPAEAKILSLLLKLTGGK